MSRLDLALDTPDRQRVMPFWQAVLGMARADHPELGIDLPDPADVLPRLWFQPSGDEEPRRRWHHDLLIDPAEAQVFLDGPERAAGQVEMHDVLVEPDTLRIEVRVAERLVVRGSRAACRVRRFRSNVASPSAGPGGPVRAGAADCRW